MIKVFSLVMLMLAVPASARGKYIQLDPHTTIRVLGYVGSLKQEANQLLDLSTRTKQVTVVIDSLGGSVLGGMMLLRAMERVKTRGVRLRCIVTGHAMSMAMHILAACQSRYALPLALMMWHPPMYLMPAALLDAKEAKRRANQLQLYAYALDGKLRQALGLSEKVFNKYKEAEYIMSATYLMTLAPNFIKLVDDVRE